MHELGARRALPHVVVPVDLGEDLERGSARDQDTHDPPCPEGTAARGQEDTVISRAGIGGVLVFRSVATAPDGEATAGQDGGIKKRFDLDLGWTLGPPRPQQPVLANGETPHSAASAVGPTRRS